MKEEAVAPQLLARMRLKEAGSIMARGSIGSIALSSAGSASGKEGRLVLLQEAPLAGRQEERLDHHVPRMLRVGCLTGRVELPCAAEGDGCDKQEAV